MKSINEPGGYSDSITDGATTEFVYSGQFTREVKDPRISEGVASTKYILDQFGITKSIEGPLGQRTEFKWATKDNPDPDAVHGSMIDKQFVPGVDALLLYRIDSLGNKTEFKYDKLGT